MSYKNYFAEFEKYKICLEGQEGIISNSKSLLNNFNNSFSAIRTTYFDKIENCPWKEKGKNIVVNNVLIGFENSLNDLGFFIQSNLVPACNMAINRLLPVVLNIEKGDLTLQQLYKNLEALEAELSVTPQFTYENDWETLPNGKKVWVIQKYENSHYTNLIKEITSTRQDIKQLETTLNGWCSDARNIIGEIKNLQYSTSNKSQKSLSDKNTLEANKEFFLSQNIEFMIIDGILYQRPAVEINGRREFLEGNDYVMLYDTSNLAEIISEIYGDNPNGKILKDIIENRIGGLSKNIPEYLSSPLISGYFVKAINKKAQRTKISYGKELTDENGHLLDDYLEVLSRPINQPNQKLLLDTLDRFFDQSIALTYEANAIDEVDFDDYNERVGVLATFGALNPFYQGGYDGNSTFFINGKYRSEFYNRSNFYTAPDSISGQTIHTNFTGNSDCIAWVDKIYYMAAANTEQRKAVLDYIKDHQINYWVGEGLKTVNANKKIILQSDEIIDNLIVGNNMSFLTPDSLNHTVNQIGHISFTTDTGEVVKLLVSSEASSSIGVGTKLYSFDANVANAYDNILYFYSNHANEGREQAYNYSFVINDINKIVNEIPLN